MPESMFLIQVVSSSTGRLAVGMPSSLEPRPKPEMTLPSMRNGKGASGPVEGPIRRGRLSGFGREVVIFAAAAGVVLVVMVVMVVVLVEWLRRKRCCVMRYRDCVVVLCRVSGRLVVVVR